MKRRNANDRQTREANQTPSNWEVLVEMFAIAPAAMIFMLALITAAAWAAAVWL